MTRKLDSQGISIALIGEFNPMIFQPFWFSSESLIRKEEADSAKVAAIHSNGSAFSSEWFNLQVTNQAFVIGTEKSSHYELLRDLVKGTFSLLRHTPVKMVGFNRFFHYQCESEDDWHSYGDKLAPKPPWEPFLSKPGLRSLTMESKRVTGDGYLRIQTEPSVKVKHGIYIMVNDHYDLTKEADMKGVLNLLENQWPKSLVEAERIASGLANQ